VIYFVSNTEAATEMNEIMPVASNIWLHVRPKMLHIQKKRVHTQVTPPQSMKIATD